MTKTAFYAWILLQAGLALGRELNLGVQDLRLDLSERDKDPPSARERKGPRRTIMQCLGTETLTRACHFENVYYELSTERFVHFGIAGARQEVFGDDTPIASMPDDPWLRLIKGDWRWRKGEEEHERQFYLDWRPGEALPAAEEVAVFAQPLHLRAPYNTVSLGHLIRDNLQFLVDLPIRFGREPAEFDWVRWHSEIRFGDWQEESGTAQHYRGLFNGRPSLTWQQVLDDALVGRNASRVKYVMFSELIGGQGPADIATQVLSLEFKVNSTQMSSWAHMCDPFAFSEMRRIAYRNHGLQVKSVHELEPFVLILDGQPDERRHVVNAGALLPAVKDAFPGVRVEYTQISKLPLERQLALLSKATVLISNIGSRSFRLIYLPNGATTILIGPPEYTFDLTPPPTPSAWKRYERHGAVHEVTPYRIDKPFLEIDWCWGYIGYVNMLRYRVQSEAEVALAPGEKWHTWIEARNADTRLEPRKLTALIGVALQRAEHSAAHRGTGTLSAYSP